MAESKEIHELLQSLTKGSLPAFEKLYNQYSGKLYNFMMRISSGDQYIAEEVVQQTFIRLWETREKVNPDEKFISYLCTIARNMAMNMYQHQTVEYVYTEYMLKNSSDHDYQTEENTDLRFLNDYIDSLAEKLPPSRKKVFLLSKRQGYTNKEIAAMLGISESTVTTQLSLAVKFMREQFMRHYDKLIFLLWAFFVNETQ